MVSELQFDTILKARQDADKAKRPCRCCGTQLSYRDGQPPIMLTLDHYDHLHRPIRSAIQLFFA